MDAALAPAGDFSAWYRAQHPRLVSLVTAAVGDLEIGREAADEALARALQHWGRVSAMSAPAGWVYRVALNVARRRVRRQALESRLLGRLGASEEATLPDPLQELWVLVEHLPQRQREALLLRHVGQLTEAEIGVVMGVKRGTVSATLRAAHDRLREQLDEDLTLEEVTHV